MIVPCQVLESGGNAAEAAVAIQLALAVVEPQHVSILGGGAMVMKNRGDVPLRVIAFLRMEVFHVKFLTYSDTVRRIVMYTVLCDHVIIMQARSRAS